MDIVFIPHQADRFSPKWPHFYLKCSKARHLLQQHSEQHTVRIENSTVARKMHKGLVTAIPPKVGNVSFRIQLEAAIAKLNAKQGMANVLMWGTGFAFPYLVETLKDETRTLIIEHDERRKYIFPEKLSKRMEQKMIPVQQPYGKSGNYATFPLLKHIADGVKYDLVIVDGRNRADCLASAALVLADGGRVLLHDAQRKSYHENFSFFRDVSITGNNNAPAQTVVLENPVFSLAKPATKSDKERSGK